MRSEKETIGEARGCTGLAPEPMSEDSPAPTVPAPGTAGEAGGKRWPIEAGAISIIINERGEILRVKSHLVIIYPYSAKVRVTKKRDGVKRVWVEGAHVDVTPLIAAALRTALHDGDLEQEVRSALAEIWWYEVPSWMRKEITLEVRKDEEEQYIFIKLR